VIQSATTHENGNRPLFSFAPPRTVSLFGDSIAVESQGYLLPRVPVLHTHTYGGTALCDWLARLRTALDQEHPSAVVLIFFFR
jgi:hypothetical protein